MKLELFHVGTIIPPPPRTLSLNLLPDRFLEFVLLWKLEKSTSRHIFEKVPICIGRGIFCTNTNEINAFENVIFGKKCVPFLLAS